MTSPPARIEPALPDPSSAATSPSPSFSEMPIREDRRFADLRGVQWRIDLGILPSSSCSPIDELRRVTANTRRRYAALRRRLLVDPQIPKDGSNSPNLVMDNPLSQNPDSMWGRFFRNAELERMLDQDLSRLYPEQDSYFQTPGCQGMLRRILLLWCLRHPEYGYRQGMHELLAPLLYVLQVDTEHLSEVRKLYEEHFTDKFDGFSFHESDLVYHFDFKKFSESIEDEIDFQKKSPKISSLDELDPKIQAIISLSDAYGAEGELGIVLSEKFLEHDAYSMFDALMNGAGGAVAMAEFFSHSAQSSSHTGLPPVIEASSSLYHLLSIVDLSLHSHLVELGVEPQYFALRWLRVLFGREFALVDLLIIWDEIFASDNSRANSSAASEDGSSFGILSSHRGAFITAIAVSMILYLRSSLLATENATSCLQRLLNFPAAINLKKLIAKAKSLQAIALDVNNSAPLPIPSVSYSRSKSVVVRGHSLSTDSVSPTTPLSLVPESYWEEKWRVLHKAEELKKGGSEKETPRRKKGWSEKVRLGLSRTESAPTPSKIDSRKKEPKLPVRRNLLEDLSRQLDPEQVTETVVHNEEQNQHNSSSDESEEKVVCNEDPDQKHMEPSTSATADRFLSGNVDSEANSSIFSDTPSPRSGAHNHESESDRSSVASNLLADENDVEANNNAESCSTNPENSALPVSDPENSTLPILNSSENDMSLNSGQKDDEKMVNGWKERKLLSGKFQWLWKFGRNGGEGTSEATKASSNVGLNQNCAESSSMAIAVDNPSVISKGEAVDQNMMVTLKNLGHSMLENIQVVESVFQQDRGGQVASLENFSKNVLVGKGQVTAMAALKELRKISNLLSEM